MRKLITLWSVFAAFMAFGQISDLPVFAEQSTVCTGDSTNINLANSQQGILYSLRNSSNVVIGNSQLGNGGDLAFNTGPISSASETYNMYAEPNQHTLNLAGSQYVNATTSTRGIGYLLTVGAWVKTSASGVQRIVSRYSGSEGFILYLDANGKAVMFGNVPGSVAVNSGPSTTTINDGQWHFVVGVATPWNWTIYVDGILENTGVGTGNLFSVAPPSVLMRIGMYNSSEYFVGEMDEVFLLDVEANSTRVANLYNSCISSSEPDLVGLYKFDELGVTAFDSSPQAAHGSIVQGTHTGQAPTPCYNASTPMQMTQTATVNTVILANQSVSGPSTVCPGSSATISISGSQPQAYYYVVDENNNAVDGPTLGTGSSMNFTTSSITSNETFSVVSAPGTNALTNPAVSLDGVNDYVNLDWPYRNITNAVSVECWVRTTETPSVNKFLVSKYDGAGGVLLIMNSSGQVRMDGKGTGGSYQVSGFSTTVINDGQWHHVVGTGVIGGSFKVYVDGVLESTGSTTINGTNFDAYQYLFLGAYSTATSQTVMEADFDQFAIWNKVLSISEIQANMSSCLTGNEANLVGYYLLNENQGTVVQDLSTSAINGYTNGNWISRPSGCQILTGCHLEMSQNVTVNVGNNPPVPDQATLANVSGQCEVTSLSPPTASDDCTGAISGTHNATFPITSNTTVMWTYDDGDGNVITQAQNVIIDDNIAPVADVASLSDVTGQCQITSLTAPTATDNCQGTITGTHNATFPITSSTSVTWTYDDGDGNIATQSQNIVINDLTAPVADVNALPDITSQCDVSALTAPTATDNCVGSVSGTHNASLPITSSTTITWTYVDGSGNISTQNQNVVINDVTAPVADISTLSDVVAQCQIASLTTPTATDNCNGTIAGTHNVSLPLTTSTTVTWSYDDGNGNVSTQTQNIVINDNTAPVADMSTLPDLTAECEITSLSPPTATDNCNGVITGTHNASLPISASTTVMWTYDDGDGNVSTQTQNVVINDVTAPVADMSALSDITAQCEVTSLTAPTAMDNCQGSISGTHNVNLPISSSTVVTWTYDDGNGNVSAQTQNVIINDATAPVPDQMILADINNECEVTPSAPTSTDNCDGVIAAIADVSFPISGNGTTVITWTYQDSNGNTATQTQNVVIADVTAPTPDITNLNDVIYECEVSPTAPTATDNCGTIITGTPDVSFPIQSSSTITWTYDDGNGNMTSQTQDVVISPMDVSTSNMGNVIQADASGYTYQWIENCGTSNDIIAGETAQSFSPTSNGMYAVILSNGNCSDTSSCVVVNDLNVEENVLLSDAKVFPNPTSGNLNIDLGMIFSKVSVRLLNVVGQEVFTGNFANTGSIELEIEGQSGVYLLEITTEEFETARFTVVKN